MYLLTYVYVYLLWLCRGMYGLNTYLQIRVNCKRILDIVRARTHTHTHSHSLAHTHTHRVISSVGFCEYAVDGSKWASLQLAACSALSSDHTLYPDLSYLVYLSLAPDKSYINTYLPFNHTYC